jgi:hypothetical protein
MIELRTYEGDGRDAVQLLSAVCRSDYGGSF